MFPTIIDPFQSLPALRLFDIVQHLFNQLLSTPSTHCTHIHMQIQISNPRVGGSTRQERDEQLAPEPQQHRIEVVGAAQMEGFYYLLGAAGFDLDGYELVGVGAFASG